MSELEANLEILEAISAQLVLITERFCCLSNAFQILINEDKLDPLDFLNAIQRSGSSEFGELAKKIQADLRFRQDIQTIN